jgi:uncharacterized protein YkwD
MLKRSVCAFAMFAMFALVGGSLLWTSLHDPSSGQAAAEVVNAGPSSSQAEEGDAPDTTGDEQGAGQAAAADPTLPGSDLNAYVAITPDAPEAQPEEAAAATPVPAEVPGSPAQVYAPPPARPEPAAYQRPAAPAPAVAPAAANVSLTVLEQDMYNSHNSLRAQSGLRGLQLDPTLEYVARQRALDMATNNYFSHYPPYLNQSRAVVFTMLENLGYKASTVSGENIARNNYADSVTVATAMNAFMASPGHAKNILDGRFKYVGVGVAYATNGIKYYAVVFAG